MRLTLKGKDSFMVLPAMLRSSQYLDLNFNCTLLQDNYHKILWYHTVLSLEKFSPRQYTKHKNEDSVLIKCFVHLKIFES